MATHDIYDRFERAIAGILGDLEREGVIPDGTLLEGFSCEPPRDKSHGEMATNAAMVLAKRAGMKPRDLAEAIAAKLRAVEGVAEVEIAGPGFINLTLQKEMWQGHLGMALWLDATDKGYGRSDLGEGEVVNVEYVSANPTGPLHAAHARGAIIGDSLANLLEFVGYEVIREYYINDAGSQVDTLGRTTYQRYREALGETIDPISNKDYAGEYLKDVGKDFADEEGDAWLNKPEEEWLPVIRNFAMDAMMESIEADLERLGIKMDVFSSERRLVKGGAVERAMKSLKKRGLIYQGMLDKPKGGKDTDDDWEPRVQTLFKATEFGDDTDRATEKSDGSWTYFSTDAAYHLDKLVRKGAVSERTDKPMPRPGRLINIWGADHAGYVRRMQAATTALSGREGVLDVQLFQLVRMMNDGKPVKMSKRAGNFIMLSDVLDAVGKDILRFMMLTRRGDQPMDFDYAKVTEQSRDNPVFYVQYAHARAKSVLRSASALENDALKGEDEALKGECDYRLLDDAAEMHLIRTIAAWPRQVELAAKAHEPHRIAFYLQDLAAAFHALWNKGRDDPSLRFIREDAPDYTAARLMMVEAVAVVISRGLGILGVDAREDM